MLIRDAEAADLPALARIYDHYVDTSTCTYDLEHRSLEEWQEMLARRSDSHPMTVAVLDDEIAGYAYLSSFRAKPGYRFTVENTVYVAPDRQRRGVGRALMLDLIERARRAGARTIIAGISAEQEASIALHRSLGFADGARLVQVGRKHDTWLDVVFMQLLLD